MIHVYFAPRKHTSTKRIHDDDDVPHSATTTEMVLLGISPVISPDLLDALFRMGHGDEIVLADAHFPGESLAKKHGVRLVRADGLTVPQLLQGILPLFPLDTFVDSPLAMMQKVEGDCTDTTPTINAYKTAIKAGCDKKDGKVDCRDPSIVFHERFHFYEVASKAAVIVMTGETAKYGNIILKKGVCY